MKREKVPELSSKEFSSYTKEGVVVIDFFADWCMPCIQMGPIVEELAKKIKKIKFCKVNVNDSPDIAQKFSVSSIPNFTVLKNGKLVGQFIGSMSSAEDFEERLEEYL